MGEMGKNAKLKERQKWSYEEPQLDNARKFRGIYFIDPEFKEFKATVKNARKKLGTPVVLATLNNNEEEGASNKINKICVYSGC